MKRKASRTLAVLFAGTLMAACNGSVLDSSIPKHEKPIPQYLMKKIEAKGMTAGSPIMLRVFKEENVMEVWKKDNTKRYALLNTYEICKWSGNLGPKYKEGDRQAPEGFYHVTPGLMNPNSSYHLSFNLGFPNKYDRANDRTGSYLMVHGDCSSAGCYSMTDEYIEEIYALAREAFRGGQKAFQVQAFPFRMTAENMARKVNHPKFEFWKMLKEGSDHFEVTNRQPKVDVCEKRYVFNRIVEEGEEFDASLQCPPSKTPKSLALAFNAKQSDDQKIFEKVLKRNAANPFVKPEEKPRAFSVSIKAEPTIGPVSVFDPSQPKPVPAPTPSPGATQADEPTLLESDASTSETPDAGTVAGQQEFNPISAEVAPRDGLPADNPASNSLSGETPVIVDEVSKIAIPEQAKRAQPPS